jgi:hypothetical protein
MGEMRNALSSGFLSFYQLHTETVVSKLQILTNKTESCMHHLHATATTETGPFIYLLPFQWNINSDVTRSKLVYFYSGSLCRLKRDSMDAATRFHLFRTLFSIAGNPLLGDGQSAAYRMYSIFAITTGYGCWMGEVIATFIHLDNTEEMLESARIAIPIATCVWIDAFTRFSVF